MPARLISLDGRDDIRLDRLLVVVGRHRQCDARIDSLRVSRRHCCLALDSDALLVRDLGSVNGTWINGRRVEEGELRPGDELAVAHYRYRLDIRRDRTSPPEPETPLQGDSRLLDAETTCSNRSPTPGKPG